MRASGTVTSTPYRARAVNPHRSTYRAGLEKITRGVRTVQIPFMYADQTQGRSHSRWSPHVEPPKFPPRYRYARIVQWDLGILPMTPTLSSLTLAWQF